MIIVHNINSPIHTPIQIHSNPPSPIQISDILSTPKNSLVHFTTSSPFSSPIVEPQSPTIDVDKIKVFVLVPFVPIPFKASLVHSLSPVQEI